MLRVAGEICLGEGIRAIDGVRSARPRISFAGAIVAVRLHDLGFRHLGKLRHRLGIHRRPLLPPIRWHGLHGVQCPAELDRIHSTQPLAETRAASCCGAARLHHLPTAPAGPQDWNG